MLTFVCLWSALAAAALPAGAAILRLAAVDEIDRAGDRLVVSVWLGVALISVALLAASLAVPLAATTGLLIVVVLIAASSASRAAREEVLAFARALKARLPPLLAWLAGVALYSAQPVVWYDTGLYHSGAIRWLAEYGAVRGVALIQPRFGVASSWFALAAPFESGDLAGRTTALAGGFALLLGGGHALVCASRWLVGRARASDRVMVCASALLYPVALYRGVFASPSPDAPAAVLTLTAAWAIVAVSESAHARRREEGARRVLDARVVAMVLSAFAVTIKMSALPVAAACALFYVAGVASPGARLRRLLSACAVAVVFAAPVVAYQIVTSGCPALPLPAACLDVPWGIGAGQAREFRRAVVEYGRWNDATPADAGALDWLWRGWLISGMTYKSALLLASAAAAAVGFVLKRFARARLTGRALSWVGFAGLAFVLMFRANNLLLPVVVALALATARRRGFPGKAWLLVAGLCGVALVMCGAPSLRFGLGYAAILWSCCAVSRDETTGEQASVDATPRRAVRGGAALASLLVVAGALLGAYRFRPERVSPYSARPGRIESAGEGGGFSTLLLPPHTPRPRLTRVRLNGIEFYEPESGNQCWASPLPCAASAEEKRDFFRVPADVTLRSAGRGLSAGFARGGGETRNPDAPR